MRTNLTDDQKLLFFILGPPRAGTTIIASIFNSLEDGFCLGEPHWYLESGHEDDGAYGKVKEYYKPVQDYRLIFHTNIISILQNNPFHLGGYRETYQHIRHTCEPLIRKHVPLVDFFIIILRDPVRVLASQRDDIGLTQIRPRHINNDYSRLDELAQHPKGIVVVFEGFCTADYLLYLNDRLPFRIEGEPKIEPTGHTFGDPHANQSTEVEPEYPYRKQPALNKKWIRALEPAIGIWRKWRELDDTLN